MEKILKKPLGLILIQLADAYCVIIELIVVKYD